MRASDVVDIVLEMEHDYPDFDSYLQRLPGGSSIEEVLAGYGFTKSKHEKYEWLLEVPLQHVNFSHSFGDPDLHICHFVWVTVTPCHDPFGNKEHPNWYSADILSAEQERKLQVGFQPEKFGISSSRDCISSKAVPLYARLNSVIRDLLAAIQTVDARKHTDIYDFLKDTDKTWGKQPNRIVSRRKKPFLGR